MARAPKPDRGDLIEIFRGLYQHWAVYVGDGYVVHLAAPSEVPGAGSSSMMSVMTLKAVVKKEKLKDVVGNNKWRVNNRLDLKYKPQPACVIVSEACALVGQEMPYSVIRGNCEHFANKMRYGAAESRQVQDAVQAAVQATVGVLAGPGSAALVGRLFEGGQRQDNDIQ